ncbi:UNVERIFIED_CONTAM: Coatomer subunit zeta-1 [Sesamum latifolium]|uniref:Coatomer subunit zeta n=1 Tax=Sesamum latifolium TaxID=2727402 RepID=A0AAW2TSR3_9LAMI
MGLERVELKSENSSQWFSAFSLSVSEGLGRTVTSVTTASAVDLFRKYSRDLCPSVKNILLLDSEGKRIAVKYYSDEWPTNSAKEAFEKAVFTKTQKTNARTEAEIAMFESNIVVYKFVQDLHFYVTGGEDENELILASVLQGFFDAVDILLRIVLETDANSIASKVASHSIDSGAPFSEQTISQALATAREHLARSLLK